MTQCSLLCFLFLVPVPYNSVICSKDLSAEVEAISRMFEFEASQVQLVPVWGKHQYCFQYPQTIACSQATFHDLGQIMEIDFDIIDDDKLPASNLNFCAIRYDNETILRKCPDLKQCIEKANEDPLAYHGEFFWKCDVIGDSWSETVWNTRLSGSIQRAKETNHWDIEIFECFRWVSPTSIKRELCSVFKNLSASDLKVTPFYGSTDLFLRGNNCLLIRQATDDEDFEEETLCCSITHMATFDVLIRGKKRYLPKKLAELLASMYQFSTLNYLNKNYELYNKEKNLPQPQWKSYGILVVPLSLKFVKMEINNTSCRSTIMYTSSSTEEDLPRLLDYILSQK